MTDFPEWLTIPLAEWVSEFMDLVLSAGDAFFDTVGQLLLSGLYGVLAEASDIQVFVSELFIPATWWAFFNTSASSNTCSYHRSCPLSSNAPVVNSCHCYNNPCLYSLWFYVWIDRCRTPSPPDALVYRSSINRTRCLACYAPLVGRDTGGRKYGHNWKLQVR